ncbi:HAMP domain-containing protein, partial [Streptococcus pyogenes]
SIERDSDLTLKAEISSGDEIGATARALNAMTERFSGSLKQVVELAQQLESSAADIDSSSRASLHSAESQRNETLSIQASI